MAKKGRKHRRAEQAALSTEAEAREPAPVVAAASAAGVEAVQLAGPRAAAWSNALIAIALLYQVAMPLRYYLGERGTDERFSWRMFSTVRMQKCSVQVFETIEDDGAEKRQRVDLTKMLQIAWLGMLERYRPQVVEKVLSRRCAAPSVKHAHYVRNCSDTDGKALPELRLSRDCASGAVRKEQAP